MKYYGEPKITTIEKRKAEYIRCDVCSKKITEYYYDVTTGHHDWGNDSIDSIEHNEICLDCIYNFTTDYLKGNNECMSDYIEIEKTYFSAIKCGDYDKWEDRLVANDNK